MELKDTLNGVDVILEILLERKLSLARKGANFFALSN